MVALFDLSSLQGKIASAYAALVTGVLVLGMVALLDLLFLERQIREGEAVSMLKDAVLEMRREEKNLFLYGDRQAVDRTDDYAAASLNILHENLSVLVAIDPGLDLGQTGASLQNYRNLLDHWKESTGDERTVLQESLRDLGHRIYLAADSLSNRERRMLENAVQDSRWFLLISLLLIGLSIHWVGRRLMRAVVSPIQQLESRLASIAEGRFDHLRPPSDDREFQTLTKAFNRMLRELELRRKRMLHSEKLASLGILASGVAHELNNPLSNISSSCQLLMEELQEADPQQLETWLRQIDSETKRGRNIVRTLLDFGTQRVFERKRQNLSEILRETHTILSKTLRQSEARLSFNIPDDLLLSVDKQRLQQLLINLIQNALNAADGPVSISISATAGDQVATRIPERAEVAGNLSCMTGHGGRFVEIMVCDDGPGIAAEDLPKVLDPFFTTSEPGHGVGLGLYIVQEIVREHDGSIAIASQSGKGTRVIMLFPQDISEDE